MNIFFVVQINRPRKKWAITTQNKGSDIQDFELSMGEWLLNESKLSLINPTVDLSLIKISFSL